MAKKISEEYKRMMIGIDQKCVEFDLTQLDFLIDVSIVIFI